MSVLTDRASLKRALFRLVGTSDSDGAMTEQDSGTLEGIYQILQYGLWDAQEWLVENGLSTRWVKQSSTLSWSGTESSDGGRYADLPSDFMRLAGDREHSALRRPNGKRWGQLIDFSERFDRYGNWYWLQNDRIWITRGASPHSDLIMDYHYRLPTLADGTTVDFPEADRALIVAFAAERARAEAWLPGSTDMDAKIVANLRFQQQQARKRARRAAGPRHYRMPSVRGTHYF